MTQEFAEGQKVGVMIPNQQHKCYEFALATIKEYDGRTDHCARGGGDKGRDQDWYTVVLDSGEVTRVRGEKISERTIMP